MINFNLRAIQYSLLGEPKEKRVKLKISEFSGHPEIYFSPGITFFNSRIILQTVTAVVQLMTKHINTECTLFILQIKLQLILRCSTISELKIKHLLLILNFNHLLYIIEGTNYLIFAFVETHFEFLLTNLQIVNLM